MGIFNIVQHEQKGGLFLAQFVQELVKVGVFKRSDSQNQALVVFPASQLVQLVFRHPLDDQMLLFGIAVDFSGKVLLNPFSQEDLVDLFAVLGFQKVDSGMTAEDKIIVS